MVRPYNYTGHWWSGLLPGTDFKNSPPLASKFGPWKPHLTPATPEPQAYTVPVPQKPEIQVIDTKTIRLGKHTLPISQVAAALQGGKKTVEIGGLTFHGADILAAIKEKSGQ